MQKVSVFLLLLCSSYGYAQTFTMTVDKGVLYVFMPNQVTITAPGHSPYSFVVTTDNGKIEKNEHNDNYILSPDKTGIARVSLGVRTAGEIKKIGTTEFDIKPIPIPKAEVGRKTGGQIRLNELRYQSCVIASLDGIVFFDARWKVTKFTLVVERNNEDIFSHKNYKACFDETSKNILSRIQVGDKVNIKDISAISPVKSTATLQNIILEVIE